MQKPGISKSTDRLETFTQNSLHQTTSAHTITFRLPPLPHNPEIPCPAPAPHRYRDIPHVRFPTFQVHLNEQWLVGKISSRAFMCTHISYVHDLLPTNDSLSKV